MAVVADEEEREGRDCLVLYLKARRSRGWQPHRWFEGPNHDTPLCASTFWLGDALELVTWHGFLGFLFLIPPMLHEACTNKHVGV